MISIAYPYLMTLLSMLSAMCCACCGKMAGRPAKELDLEEVKYLLAFDFKLEDIAALLDVSRSTLYRHMKNAQIEKYTDISDRDLDETVRRIKRDHPNDGEVLMQAHLLRVGVRVQRQRLRLTIHRVDPTNTALRRATTVRRRVYQVQGPNSVWHLDGNHKLIRWRFVIHGGVDGFSQMIVFLQCCTNNTAPTVLTLFEDAIRQYGLPEKVRTDLGGENTDVWRLMSDIHNSSSAVITGSSTHNERIERLWNDVRRSVTEEFRCLFYQMEYEGSLNPLNETDMYCLHYVFEIRINHAINEFAVAWNNHKLSTEGNRSPNQLFMMGMLSSPAVGSTPMLPSTPVAAQQDRVNTTARHSTTSLPGVLSHVCVPRSRFEPCTLLQQELQSHINPLGESHSYGKDIYLNAMSVVCTHLQNHANCCCVLH